MQAITFSDFFGSPGSMFVLSAKVSVRSTLFGNALLHLDSVLLVLNISNVASLLLASVKTKSFNFPTKAPRQVYLSSTRLGQVEGMGWLKRLMYHVHGVAQYNRLSQVTRESKTVAAFRKNLRREIEVPDGRG